MCLWATQYKILVPRVFSTWTSWSNLRKCYLMISEEGLKTEMTSAGSEMPMQYTWLHLKTAMPYRLQRCEEKLKWPDTTGWALGAGSLPGLRKDSAAGKHGVALMSWNTGGCFLEAGEVCWRGSAWVSDRTAAESICSDLFLPPYNGGSWVSLSALELTECGHVGLSSPALCRWQRGLLPHPTLPLV